MPDAACAGQPTGAGPPRSASANAAGAPTSAGAPQRAQKAGAHIHDANVQLRRVTLPDPVERPMRSCPRHTPGNCAPSHRTASYRPTTSTDCRRCKRRSLPPVCAADVRSRKPRGYRRLGALARALVCVFARDTRQALLQRHDGLIQRSLCGQSVVHLG